MLAVGVGGGTGEGMWGGDCVCQGKANFPPSLPPSLQISHIYPSLPRFLPPSLQGTFDSLERAVMVQHNPKALRLLRRLAQVRPPPLPPSLPPPLTPLRSILSSLPPSLPPSLSPSLQSSRHVCLELAGRGFLRASKGLLGLEGGREGGRGDAPSSDDDSLASTAPTTTLPSLPPSLPACKVEVLRIWRVALAYGADVEGVLDVLAVVGGMR